MKKQATEKEYEATGLCVAFATLVNNLYDFTKTMKDKEYAAFLTRIAASVDLQSLKFKEFAKAAGMLKD